jgi:hypothetical protein
MAVMTTWKRWNGACLCHLAAASLAAAWGGSVKAGELAPSNWTFSGANATDMKKAVDDDLGTLWESDGPQIPGSSILVDLGQDAYVYGFFMTPGKALSRFPRSLEISVGETPETLQRAGSAAWYWSSGDIELNREGDKKPYFPYYGPGHRFYAPSYVDLYLQPEWNIRFQPVRGRYVKIAIGGNGAGVPWAIAEMDIHGALRNSGRKNKWLPFMKSAMKSVEPGDQMAVVVDKAMLGQSCHPVMTAANDLQYYLMELLDEPVRLISSEEAAACKGLTFRLQTPPEGPALYPEPDPKALDDVSVTRDGSTIIFAGPTARAVVYGVYEFLSRQGVRWVYPESHAEIVPSRKSLDLSILPLAYHPPFGRRAFNIARPYFDFGYAKSPLDSLFANRNGISFGTVPRDNVGFGHMHTMGEIFTDKSSGEWKSLKLTHPEWWPTGSSVPCTSNPEVLEHILKRMNEDERERKDKKWPAVQGYGVAPDDGASFCACARCAKLFGKDPSAQYFYLIDELAKRMKTEHPAWFLRAAAYEGYVLTPKNIALLPDNVVVDMMPMWQQTLPSTSPKNMAIRKNFEAWGAKCASPSFGIWSYMLIYLDTTFSRPSGEWNALVPNASAIMEQMKFYRQIGVRSVGTQVMGPQHHWPWGFYAWGRSAWNPDADPQAVLVDFFKGYYGEAWAPMLKWYKAMEEAAWAKDIGSDKFGGSAPSPELFTDELTARMRILGREAQKLATHWYVKERVTRAMYDLEWTYRKARWKTEEPPMVYPCHRLGRTPVMDGKLDDDAWKTLPECRGFRVLATRLGPDRPGWFDFKNQTGFRIGHDDKFIYLAMTCVDPNMPKVIAADKDKNARHESLDLSFGPCGLTISSAGSARNLRSGVTAKTAYGEKGWTLEAQFPIGAPLKAGTRWPAALNRWSFSGGEWGSTWSDVLQFQGLNGGPWANASCLEIKDASLDVAEASAIETALNREFDVEAKRYAGNQERIAAFTEKTKGMENLADPKKGARHSNNVSYSRYYEIAWKDPVEFDSVRVPVTWQGRRQVRPWFSLEWWDGSQYRLLEEVRDNTCETRVFEFPPIRSSRLRLTLWDDRSHTEGWHDSRGLLSPMEVFKTSVVE